MTFRLIAMSALVFATSSFANESELSDSTDQVKNQAEIERLDKENSALEKTNQENLTRAQKLKSDIETLKALRGEKAKHFIELTSQHDKVIADIKKMEQEKAQLETDLTKAKEEEKSANENLQKAKVEAAAKKVKLESYIAGLRERFRQAQQRLAALEAQKSQVQSSTQKMEATAKVAENEVVQVESRLTRNLASSAESTGNEQGQYVFKRNCKVFDKPARDAKVLLTKQTGDKISKNDEGKTWIGFALQDGRKGYAAKVCF